MTSALTKSGIGIVAIGFFALPQFTTVDAKVPSPETPNAGVSTSTLPVTLAETVSIPSIPIELRIPSIGLVDPIIPVGINAKGEMDVPSGKTNNVGWYEYGPTPGEEGSSVIDAHVYAAFKNLKRVSVGDDIYVTHESGEVRHFVVRKATVYPLATLSPLTLFDYAPGRWLNLITCAGSYIPSLSTYDHRLIVFAEFVS